MAQGVEGGLHEVTQGLAATTRGCAQAQRVIDAGVRQADQPGLRAVVQLVAANTSVEPTPCLPIMLRMVVMQKKTLC